MDLYELDDTKQLQTCDAVVILSFKKLDYVPRLDRECTTLLHKVSKAEKLRFLSRVGFPSVAIPCCMDVMSLERHKCIFLKHQVLEVGRCYHYQVIAPNHLLRGSASR